MLNVYPITALAASILASTVLLAGPWLVVPADLTVGRNLQAFARKNGTRPPIEDHPHLRTFSPQKCNNLRSA